VKNADNMTPKERLKRIRSLEEKVSRLQCQLMHAEERIESKDAWAREAWAETRRCWDLLILRAKLKDDVALPSK
jgi:hypothetical protein